MKKKDRNRIEPGSWNRERKMLKNGKQSRREGNPHFFCSF